MSAIEKLWMGLGCGDPFCRWDDPRHEGRVDAIFR